MFFLSKLLSWGAFVLHRLSRLFSIGAFVLPRQIWLGHMSRGLLSGGFCSGGCPGVYVRHPLIIHIKCRKPRKTGLLFGYEHHRSENSSDCIIIIMLRYLTEKKYIQDASKAAKRRLREKSESFTVN